MSFSLLDVHVELDVDTIGMIDSQENLADGLLVAHAKRLQLSLQSNHKHQPQELAVLVPQEMVQGALQQAQTKATPTKSKANVPATENLTLWDATTRRRVSQQLLPRIHPVLATCGILVQAVVSSSQTHSPAAVVLLRLPSTNTNKNSTTATLYKDIIDATNGVGMADPLYRHCILKVFLVAQVNIYALNSALGVSTPTTTANVNSEAAPGEIPTCPVCIHRLDPIRLGLPKVLNHHLCSNFCLVNTTTNGCPRQLFLQPWPEPSHCIACHVIHDYQHHDGSAAFGAHAAANATAAASIREDHQIHPSSNTTVFCNECALDNTLWVCLTCGFCGCGRYSNKHAQAHFLQSQHAYSLELATLRIWDYRKGEFAHRGDLLECKGAAAMMMTRQHHYQYYYHDGRSPPHVAPAAAAAPLSLDQDDGSRDQNMWARQQQQQPHYWNHHHDQDDKSSPKKAIMIGEEYEALLQSALEDQAQHYEGEITRLRAAMTADNVDMDALSPEEAKLVDELQSEIANLRNNVAQVSQCLLEAQAQEAGHRADSQRLLREQQVLEDLFKTIQHQAQREQEQGNTQMEELEQQIADLTANLRMRHQFLQHEELSQAQILNVQQQQQQQQQQHQQPARPKKGKLRRLFRK